MPWLALTALAIYLALVGLAYRQRNGMPCIAHSKIETGLLTFGLLLHGTATFSPFTLDLFHFGAAEALSLTAWLALALYLAGKAIWRLVMPLDILVSLAASLLLISLLIPASPPLDYTLTPLARGHILIAMLAYGMLTNAAAIALLMRLADSRLHHPRASMLQKALPPLLTLEQLLFLCLWSGFILLTLTLLTGSLFASEMWGHALAFNHKTMFSLVTWLFFGLLLAGHHRQGWRGRLAANWVLAGYILLLLGYMGAQLVMASRSTGV